MERANLDLLVGKLIRVDRGGPESRLGKLLAVKGDHLVVYINNDSEEGILYYKTDHIRSLSLDTRDVTDIPPVTTEETVLPNYFDEEDFASVMKNMKFRWVQINRGGHEKIEGVLIDATDELVTMINGNEVIHVLPFHIRNISYVIQKQNDKHKGNEKDKGEEKRDDQGKNKEENKENKKSEDKGNKKEDQKENEKDSHKNQPNEPKSDPHANEEKKEEKKPDESHHS